MIKKIKNIITVALTAVFAYAVSGCALIKDGEAISWTKVDTVASVIQVAAQTSTYAVCIKNKDLSPIFKAVGEGFVVISGSADGEQLKPAQIEAYIKTLLDENKWGSLSTQVNGILSTVLTAYTNFYNENKGKFKDEVIVCSVIVKAIGQGLIVGSNIEAARTSADVVSPEASRDNALKMLDQLDYNVAK